MIVTSLPQPTLATDLIKGPPNETGSERSTGKVHLSTVYRDLCKEALLTRYKSELSEADLHLYAAGGFLWEWLFALAYKNAYTDGDVIRTDEWELDGIVGSPDGVRVLPYRVVETKFRWMSANKIDNLEKYFWPELVQCKGYCKMVGTNAAELHVYFVNGDYKPPVPRVESRLLEFSDQELDENWWMVTNHARRRGWL